MHQFIYGNINKSGYSYNASNLSFFTDPNNAGQLKQWITYDLDCIHGDLKASESRCYWMLTTDTGNNASSERLYLHVAGADEFRTSYYVQGYTADTKEIASEELYGQAMADLLRIRFPSFQEITSAMSGGPLLPKSFHDLPIDQTLQPAALPADVMRCILRTLLEDNKQIVIRIPATGADAIRCSRELLLAIYLRLPYGLRRTNGFMTGASADRVRHLPGTVTIVIMDGDSDFSRLKSGYQRNVLDLQAPEIPEFSETTPKLLDFLTEEDPGTLNKFFCFCQDYAGKPTKNNSISTSDYAMLLDIFTLGSVQLDDAIIRFWAAKLQLVKWSPQMMNMLVESIRAVLSWSRMVEYLKNTLTDYSALADLGSRDEKECSQFLQYNGDQKDVLKDRNGGLALGLADLLFSAGQQQPEELVEHFMKLALQKYPCLNEPNPNAATLKELDQIKPEVPENSDTFANKVKAAVAASIQSRLEKLRALYSSNYAQQKEEGYSIIRSWTDPDLSGLIALLQNRFYLAPELFPDVSGETSWRNLLCSQLLCTAALTAPFSMDQAKETLHQAKINLECINHVGISLNHDEEKELDKYCSCCTAAADLEKRRWTSLSELLSLLHAVDNAGLDASSRLALKQQYFDMADQASVRREDVLAQASALAQRAIAAQDSGESELLRNLLKDVPGLTQLPQGTNANTAAEILTDLCILEKAYLIHTPVLFYPGNVEMLPAALLQQLKGVKAYQSGHPVPEILTDQETGKWALAQFRDNLDLVILLIRQFPSLRESAVHDLACSPHQELPSLVRKLFIAGCSRAQLLKGAGSDTSAEWTAAVKEVFPPWPSLPPLPDFHEQHGADRCLIAVECTLLGTAALIPGCVLLLLKAAAPIPSALLAAVLFLSGTASGLTGLFSKNKWLKYLLCWGAVAHIPGFITAILLLITSML